MSTEVGTLIFMAGKMGAGKSTLANEMTRSSRSILVSEDVWLATLYPNKITSLADYARLSKRLKPLVTELAQSLLRAGVDVVLDFPANTVAQRTWLKQIADGVGARHQLIYLDVPDSVCLARIAQRRITQPERKATDTEAMFFAVSQHFVPPSSEEMLELTVRVPDER